MNAYLLQSGLTQATTANNLVNGIINGIINTMTQLVAFLRGILPIDNGAAWIKENVPVFGAIDQPSLALAIGLIVLWILVAGFTNIIRKSTPLFIAIIIIIAIVGYMGII